MRPQVVSDVLQYSVVVYHAQGAQYQPDVGITTPITHAPKVLGDGLNRITGVFLLMSKGVLNGEALLGAEVNLPYPREQNQRDDQRHHEFNQAEAMATAIKATPA